MPIKIFHTTLNPEQKIEDDFFGSSKSVGSVQDFYKILFWKTRSLWLFAEIIKKYHLNFSGKILELAGGYGAHATYLKSQNKNSTITCSDISLNALSNCSKFENFFNCSLDEKWIAEAESIPAPDQTFDVIYFFASFHHIQNPEKSLAECRRTLKANGQLMLLLEPACPKFWEKIYAKIKKREIVPEKSFTKTEYQTLLKKHFSQIKFYNFTNFYNRESAKSLFYYLLLSRLPNFIINFFPCSQVIIATNNLAD